MRDFINWAEHRLQADDDMADYTALASKLASDDLEIRKSALGRTNEDVLKRGYAAMSNRWMASKFGYSPVELSFMSDGSPEDIEALDLEEYKLLVKNCKGENADFLSELSLTEERTTGSE